MKTFKDIKKLNHLRNTSDYIDSNIIDFIPLKCKFKLNQLRNTSDDINFCKKSL